MSRPMIRVALQHWEGYVYELTPDAFIACLVDLDDPAARDVEAEILLSAIAEEDLELVSPGAVVDWTIGYQDQLSAARGCISIIRFRPLPALAEEDIEGAREEAKAISDRLGWY
jgi:hypothetical protein